MPPSPVYRRHAGTTGSISESHCMRPQACILSAKPYTVTCGRAGGAGEQDVGAGDFSAAFAPPADTQWLRPGWGSRNPLMWVLWIITRPIALTFMVRADPIPSSVSIPCRTACSTPFTASQFYLLSCDPFGLTLGLLHFSRKLRTLSS